MISVLMPLAGDLAQMDISMTLPRGFPDNDNNSMMTHNGMTMTPPLIVINSLSTMTLMPPCTIFENNRRFDASRWGGGSDGHLYDFVKRGFQPSRWASGSDGHLYDFAKRLGDNDKTIQRQRQRQKCPPAPMGISMTLLRGWETMTRKIQIQSKKTKWALAQLDISTILYKHDVDDDNDDSPAMLIEEAHLVPTLTILLKGSSL